MLWVRTVTQVDEALLAGTGVRFVGTATAGYDHLDTGWLDRNGIAWAYAPGANAVAVAEYVLCVIAALRTRDQLRGPSLRAGVIGVGQVGRIVADYLAQAGFQLILNDPPRAAPSRVLNTPLTEFANLDLLCLHPALVRAGRLFFLASFGRHFFEAAKIRHGIAECFSRRGTGYSGVIAPTSFRAVSGCLGTRAGY